MNVLLDNLTAVVVGTVLLAAFAALQLRGSEKGIEVTERYRAEAMVDEMARVVERELENVRSRGETERAFAISGASAGADTYRFRLRRATTPDGTAYTAQASFPTLLEPDRLTRSPIGIVTYHAEPTGETVEVDGRERALLRVTRYEYPRGGPVRNSGAFEGLVDFDVTVYGADGSATEAAEEVPGHPVRIGMSMEAAPAFSGDVVGPAIGVTHGRTVRIAAAATLEGASPVDADAPGGIPGLPGDPGVVGPPPTTDTPDPDGGATGGDIERDKDGKYAMCHAPIDDPKTKWIKPEEVAEHLGHGDHFGHCPGD